MASYTITINARYISETSRYTVGYTTPFPNGADGKDGNDPAVLQRGDTVTWKNASGSNTNATVNSIDLTIFSGTAATKTLSPNSQYTVTVENTATIGAQDTMSFGAGNKSISWRLEVGNPSMPEGFTNALGPTLGGCELDTWYVSAPYVVKGLGASVTCRIDQTNRCELWKNDVYVNGLSTSVSNGDLVYMKIKSSTAYGAGTLRTMWVGDGIDSWRINTKPDPETLGVDISHTFPGDISLDTVSEFFSGKGGDTRQNPGQDNDYDAPLTAYYRGGDYVPDIADNSTIPTSGEIKLTQFRNIFSKLFFNVPPPPIVERIEVDYVVDDKHYSWKTTAGVDWFMGYGLGMTDACEFRYELLQSYVTKADGVKTAVGGAQLTEGSTSWSNINDFARLEIDIDIRAEAHFEGGVRVWARNKIDPSQEIYADFTFDVFIYDRNV